MTVSMTGGTVRINGGAPFRAELEVRQEIIDVSTRSPKPDPRWSAGDAAGHFHARSADGTYPTLLQTSEHRDCDGGCGGSCDGEGYDVTVWSCSICGEQMTPGTVPGPHEQSMPGRSSWVVRFDGPSLSGPVSVRYEAGGGTVFFGIAHAEVSSLTLSAGRSGGAAVASVELTGVSPLGRIGPEPVEQRPGDEVLERFIADAQVAPGQAPEGSGVRYARNEPPIERQQREARDATPRPPELDLDWHGDAYDEHIDATGHVLSFRRFGPLVNFGITPGAVTVLTADQAEDLAANLYAAARAARKAAGS